MLEITPATATALLGLVRAFEHATGAPPGSLDRLAQGVRILAGLDPTLPEDPYQRPNFFLPGLTARRFWDPADFPFTARLEASWETILGELLALRERNVFGREPETDLVGAGTWAQFDFAIHGKKLAANCALCPHTTEILDSIKEARDSDLKLFSANVPGTHVRPHCGPHNARLRCHLGLLAPEGCEIRVGDEVRSWREGRCLLFDDSFEHEVWNRGSGTRIVLLLDVWHPEVTAIEQAAIRELMKAFKAAVLPTDEDQGARIDRFEHVQGRAGAPLPEHWWV